MVKIDMEMPTSCEECKIWSLCWAEDPHWWKRREDCPLHEDIDIHTGYVGVDDDYPVSVKQVLNITAELGALETQSRVRELPRYQVTDPDTVSRQDARMCLTGDVTDMSIEQYIKMVDKRLEQLPPSLNSPKTLDANSQCVQGVESVEDDTVSRQTVIDTVRKIILGFFSNEDGVMNDTEKTLLSVNKAVCNGVRELPPAQQRWIPCSERLPDELAEVNITWINTNPAPYYEFTKGKPNTGSAVYYKGRWYWYSSVCADYLAEYGFSPDDDMDDAIKVIAWMPLPEPYTERRTDE